LNLPIAVSISVLGMTPASLLPSAFTITMNRIVALRLCHLPGPPIARRTIARQQDEPGFAVPTCPVELFWR
jgi:hypothetical protein